MIKYKDKILFRLVDNGIDINAGGIYAIKNVITNHIYIGQAKKFLHRLYAHQQALLHNNHANTHMQNSFNKYGIEQFEAILLEQTTKRNEREIYWMNYFVESHTLYNVREGGDFTSKFSKEHSKKLSDTHKRRRDELFAKCKWLFACYPWCKRFSQKKLVTILEEIKSAEPSIDDICDYVRVTKWAEMNKQIPEIIYPILKYKLPPWTRKTLSNINMGHAWTPEGRLKRKILDKEKSRIAAKNRIRLHGLLDAILESYYEYDKSLRKQSATKKMKTILYIANMLA